MIEFQLFRARAFAPKQQSLIDREISPSDALIAAIRSKPEVPGRHGHLWHIGNILEIGGVGLYFRIGRTTRATIALYDDESKNFVEEEFESAPYTHVLLDSRIEVCAIGRKSLLAPSTDGIARRLQALLNASELAKTQRYDFQVSALIDPDEFIKHLREAHAIRKFSFTFRRPNPIDANKDIYQPLGRALQSIKGDQGAATFKGQDMQADVLEDIARTVASTGDQASADVISHAGEGTMKKHLRGNIVGLSAEEPQDDADRKRLLTRIRELYSRVRSR